MWLKINNFRFYWKACHSTCRQSISWLHNLGWKGHLTTTCLNTIISFGDVADLICKSLLTRKVVYFVTDQRKSKSIKFLDREDRKASGGTMQVRIEKRCKGDWSNERHTWEMIKIIRSLVSSCWRIGHIRRTMLIYFLLLLFCFLTVAQNFSDWV